MYSFISFLPTEPKVNVVEQLINGKVISIVLLNLISSVLFNKSNINTSLSFLNPIICVRTAFSVGCEIKKARQDIKELMQTFNGSSNDAGGKQTRYTFGFRFLALMLHICGFTSFLLHLGQITLSGSCSGTYKTNKNEITTPNYPGHYGHHDDCNWKIEAPQGRRIELRFVAFSLESSTDCRYDWLQVYDGRSSSSRTIGSKMCGNSPPASIVSRGNYLYLRFKSDEDTPSTGFKILCKVKCKCKLRKKNSKANT